MICARREKEGVETKIEGSTQDIILELCLLYDYILKSFREEGDVLAANVLVRTMHFQEIKEQQEETIKHQKDELLARMEGPMEERERILNEILEAMGGRHV